MDDNQYSEERRERPASTAERRNYTPHGRLRRILFDHRSSVWLSLPDRAAAIGQLSFLWI